MVGFLDVLSDHYLFLKFAAVEKLKQLADLAPANLFSPVALAIPILLLCLRIVFAKAKILPWRSSGGMTYVVKWGKEKLSFPLPPPETKLSTIRHELAEYTQLTNGSFKLIHAGAVMKDDNAPISSYGIKAGSTIAIIGGGDNASLHAPSKSKIASSSKASQPPTEESTISVIRSEMDKVRQSLEPDVKLFLVNLSSPDEKLAPKPPINAQTKAPSDSSMDLHHEHARLGELLLQSLLRLDAINAEGEWEQARKDRKAAVKEVQGLLDRLDGGWRSHSRT